MSQQDTAHAWWSRLRHQGLLLSPVVMLERYAAVPAQPPFYTVRRLRDAHTRFMSKVDPHRDEVTLEQNAILAWTDGLLEHYVGHANGTLARQQTIPGNLTTSIKIGTRTETIRPHRVIFADGLGQQPALLVMADESPRVGRGRGRTTYSRFLELLRGTGHRLGLLTNGLQFRLIYAGLDFESWCEWESERWFDDGDGAEELAGLRQLLAPTSLELSKAGISGLLEAIEESRKRQADLSSVLRENVRQAVELLLEEVSAASRTDAALFSSLTRVGSDRPLGDKESHDALLQASVRIVMRMVVCLFAESRRLLPVNDPIYAQSYGVRTLYELLDEAHRYEGGTYGLINRHTAWPRLMALFRLMFHGSVHGSFPMRAYGGALFRPGSVDSNDAVLRALHILEHGVSVCDATMYQVLRKLLRGPLPVLRGRAKTYVEGPVDYTDLRTEFIGLIYEGILDYRVKRTDEVFGPQIFLNIGREPVLPLARLEEMLTNDPKGLKELLTTLRKEKVTASAAAEEEETEEDAEDSTGSEEPEADSPEPETGDATAAAGVVAQRGDYLDAEGRARKWAREAVVLVGLGRKKRKGESQSEYDAEIDREGNRLIKRVVPVGEFYLVRAGNTRKGTGTFYTRPQLAVPTVHRTLEPLCYEKDEHGKKTPRKPEEILGLKVCDPACGSASFLVAALHYVTDALYESLRQHAQIEDPATAKMLTLPYGRPRKGAPGEELVPFPPDDPQRGDRFAERIKALLRRHVVERCIYGVDINPLAVEFARVSLWIETLDPELPFTFLDHKIKVGNALVGCWLDRVLDYPIRAWERNGGDDPDSKTKGPRTERIETFLNGPKIGKRRTGDGIIKQEMRAVIESRFLDQPPLFPDLATTPDAVVAQARQDYERLHDLPITNPDERERFYRKQVENSPALRQLKAAMDEWCSVWFWPMDEQAAPHVPTPKTFQAIRPHTRTLVAQISTEMRCFHWEVEFPDVFTPERCGFDAVIGNPPWEVMKPSSHEFFTEYDPIYRTYDKQTALRRQQEFFNLDSTIKDAWDDYISRFKALSNWTKYVHEPFGLTLQRGKRGTELAGLWARERRSRVGYSDVTHPFAYQGSADLNAYKLFLESSYALCQPAGLVGMIVASGIYSDLGTRELRELFLDRSQWRWIFGFINWEEIFSIYYRVKFAIVIVARRALSTQTSISASFGRYRIGDWEQAETTAFPLPREVIREFSPRTLSVLEISTARDLNICRCMYSHSFRIGDQLPGWTVSYAREFDMTNDSKHFPPLERWRKSGFEPHLFGQWVEPAGSAALPLVEGRMINQFDCSEKGWVSGRGRTARWRTIPFDHKVVEPQFLVTEQTYRSWEKACTGPKIAFMDIASSTNARTMNCVMIKDFPCGHSAPVLSVARGDVIRSLLLSACLNSLPFDYAARQRIGGLHLTWFIVEECPLPIAMRGMLESPPVARILANAARLTMCTRRYAPEWLLLQTLTGSLPEVEWKNTWAITEADRLRLRIEIDALVADLYGLTPDDYNWIVRDDPSDPKGFWRVDKQLPYRERLTGLAAAAFRALKDGKWSAENAGDLSNDEFFELLGIPELTNQAAAKAKGLDAPLIMKREGCHRWKPEEFAPEDPRYGWTWEHCWQDAIALLGSKEAVEAYIEQGTTKSTEPAAQAGFGLEMDPKIAAPRGP